MLDLIALRTIFFFFVCKLPRLECITNYVVIPQTIHTFRCVGGSSFQEVPFFLVGSVWTKKWYYYRTPIVARRLRAPLKPLAQSVTLAAIACYAFQMFSLH